MFWKEIALTVEILQRMKTTKMPLERQLNLTALGLFEGRLRRNIVETEQTLGVRG